MGYPNQKIIQCVPEDRERDNIYGSLSRKAEIVAARLLNDGTASHIVYLHFALHKGDYKFELSSQDLQNCLGISDKQYRKALDKLKKAGYLTKENRTGNVYIFKRIPDEYKFMTLEDVTTGEQIAPEGEQIAPEGERNNTYITDSIDNTGNITSLVLDNNLFLPERNNVLVTPSLETEENIDIEFDDKEQWKRHVEEVRCRVKKRYKALSDEAIWGDGTSKGYKVLAILKKYLSTQDEPIWLKKVGDRYGRYIIGWDSKKQRPIIRYSLSYPLDKDIKHSIDSIPREYYTTGDNAKRVYTQNDSPIQNEDDNELLSF